MNHILATPMGDNNAGAATIGEYLCKLLVMVLEETEGFDGKRPFGNSGWIAELHDSLGTDDDSDLVSMLTEAIKLALIGEPKLPSFMFGDRARHCPSESTGVVVKAGAAAVDPRILILWDEPHPLANDPTWVRESQLEMLS